MLIYVGRLCIFFLLLLTTCKGLDPSRSLPSPPELIVKSHYLESSLASMRVLTFIGTPPQRYELMISFSTSHSSVEFDLEKRSATYDRSLRSDLIDLGTGRFRLPIHESRERSDDDLYSCPQCRGVLGLGYASPLWKMWPSARLHNGILQFSWDSAPGESPCSPTKSRELDQACVAPNAVSPQGITRNATLLFGFGNSPNVVSDAIYDAYVGDRSLHEFPWGWGAWRMGIVGRDGTIVVPRERMLSSRLKPEEEGTAAAICMVRSGFLSTYFAGEEFIMPGRSTSRSMDVTYDSRSMSVSIHPSENRSGIPVWSLGFVLVAVLLYGITSFIVDFKPSDEGILHTNMTGVVVAVMMDILFVVSYEFLGGRHLVNEDASVGVSATYGAAVYMFLLYHLVMISCAVADPYILKVYIHRDPYLAFARINLTWFAGMDAATLSTVMFSLLQKYHLRAGSIGLLLISVLWVILTTRTLTNVIYTERAQTHAGMRRNLKREILWYSSFYLVVMPLLLGLSAFYVYYGIYFGALQRMRNGLAVSLTIVVTSLAVLLTVSFSSTWVRAAMVREAEYVWRTNKNKSE